MTANRLVTEYTYTGNDLTKVTVVPKNGAPGGVINTALALITETTYEPGCGGHCSRVKTVKDPNGLVTTYNYDPTYDVVTSIVYPKANPADTEQQVTFNSYALKNAKLKTSATTSINGSNIYRLVSTKTCLADSSNLTACKSSDNQWTRLRTH